jgi:creatinine amidohydrolase
VGSLRATIRPWCITAKRSLGSREFIDGETERFQFPDGLVSGALERAAVMEAPVTLHLRSDLVRADRIPDHPPADFPLCDVRPFDLKPIPRTGTLRSPASAIAEKRRQVTEAAVPAIPAALAQTFHG